MSFEMRISLTNGPISSVTFFKLRQRCNPDLVFTYYRNDLHQDHRVISDLTWNTFREHLILEYEIVKYDGDLGNPNSFVAVSRSHRDLKIDIILNSFISQTSKPWFTRDAFEALMRIRGIEASAPDGVAEAYHCRKARLL